jgi:hypothetical protein
VGGNSEVASPKLVIEAIKQRCENVDLRFHGYRREVLTTVSDILSLERNHRVSPTNIQKKVQDKIDVLGDQIWQRSEEKA